VAEQVHNHPRMDALRQQESRTGVAKIVEPHIFKFGVLER
jgi:hypothetical protein